jgi:hypothetical protein
VTRRLVVAIGALLCACTGTETRLPTDTPPDTTGNGGVQRATLTVRVTTAAPDTGIVRALGWTAAALPGAQVILRRGGSSLIDTALADAGGVAIFSGILPGQYTVSALRLLSGGERNGLVPADQDVNAFGGGADITVTAPTTSSTMVAAAGRRGSLVISETWSAKPFQPSGSVYYFGDFIELYNNSDTTIRLAGKLFLQAIQGWWDIPEFPCAEYDPFAGDSLGLWARYVWRFPPNTRALGPGETAVIATDALDHTAFAQRVFDLSFADAEFRGASDADNPAVPDMLSVGPTDGGNYIQGHGYYLRSIREVIAIADDVDVTALPRMTYATSTSSNDYIRIPSAKILDLLFSHATGLTEPAYPLCRVAVHPSLDRQMLNILPAGDPQDRGLARPVIYTQPNGQNVLLRTKTSARDFVLAPPSPFAIP